MKFSIFSSLAISSMSSAALVAAGASSGTSAHDFTSGILQGISGELLIDMQGVKTDTLSTKCQDDFTQAFDLAYLQVYGEDSMTVDVEKVDIEPATPSKNIVNKNVVHNAAPSQGRLTWTFPPTTIVRWNFAWFVNFKCRLCKIHPEDDFQSVLGSANKHQLYEQALTDLLRSSTCTDFAEITITLTDITEMADAGSTDTKPVLDQGIAGELLIDMQGVKTDTLSTKCQDDFTQAFDLAYLQVYGEDSMTVDVEKVDIEPATPSKNIVNKNVVHNAAPSQGRLTWTFPPTTIVRWNFAWFVNFKCRLCKIHPEDDFQSVLGSANKHQLYEQALTDLLRSSTCTDFAEITITLTDITEMADAGSTDTKPVLDQGIAGELLIDMQGVKTDTLSTKCQDDFTQAFDLAYLQVYGEDSMTVDVEKVDIEPATPSKNIVNKNVVHNAAPSQGRLTWTFPPTTIVRWNFAWFVNFKCRLCKIHPEDDFQSVLGSANKHQLYEQALTDLLRSSTCTDFAEITITLTDITEMADAGSTDTKPVLDQGIAGELLIDMQGVKTDTLSTKCQDDFTQAFDLAYLQVYGEDSMTVDVEKVDIEPATPSKNIVNKNVVHNAAPSQGRLTWTFPPTTIVRWNFAWFVNFKCRLCKIHPEDDFQSVLGSANKHQLYEQALTDLLRSSTCTDFAEITITLTDITESMETIQAGSLRGGYAAEKVA